MTAIPVNLEVFKKLKKAYSEKFGSSPSRLIQEIDKKYEYDDKYSNLISQRTISNFFKAEPIPRNTEEQNLNYLCSVLLGVESYQQAVENWGEIDSDLSEEWFSTYLEKVKRKCGTIQILDMNSSVPLRQLFTEIKIWKTRRRKQRTLDELLAALESDDRANLGNINPLETDERITGLEAIQFYPKLMLLGQLGSGKTTFLKRIALQFSESQPPEQIVPIYISLLKDFFAEEEEEPKLFNALVKELSRCVPEPERKVQTLLEQGKFLILLDGLDEISDAKKELVSRNVINLVNEYPNNRFIITCRPAAYKSVVPDFTVVEIADFDKEQVNGLVRNWFNLREKPDFADKFFKQINESPSLQEMSLNPLLLTFLCMIFEQHHRLPKNRYLIYEEAIDILLEKWDNSRWIERDLPGNSKNFDPKKKKFLEKFNKQRKINLLSKIGYDGFEQVPTKKVWQRWDSE
jgi:hypothetical protein